MRKFGWTAAIMIGALATGCASNSPSTGYGAAARDKADADAQFEASHNNPITAQTRFAAGQLAESEGNAATAVVQYSDALELQPDCTPALFRLGFVYTAREQYPQAIEMWRRYVSATGGSAEAFSNLGYCLELSGQIAEAEDTYQMGLAKEPKNRACRTNYGLMLARQNRMVEAADQLQVVLTPAEVHYDLASVLESQGKKDKARAEYAKALALNPDMVDARTRMAGL